MLNRLHEIVEEQESLLQCTCDLDCWEPEKTTGHTWVCQIHKNALAEHARELKKELEE